MNEPSRLRCEYLENPIGLNVAQPRFFWRMESPARDDRCRLYYAGTCQRHDGHDAVKTTPGIGLATFAPGRLAGQRFTGDGWCQTIPFRYPGGRLTLNVAAHKPMSVEVHSPGYGGPIAGFTRDACAPVTGDSQGHATP